MSWYHIKLKACRMKGRKRKSKRWSKVNAALESTKYQCILSCREYKYICKGTSFFFGGRWNKRIDVSGYPHAWDDKRSLSSSASAWIEGPVRWAWVGDSLAVLLIAVYKIPLWRCCSSRFFAKKLAAVWAWWVWSHVRRAVPRSYYRFKRG